MALAAICFFVCFVVTMGMVLDKIDERADALELLLDGIIDRLNKLEKK